MRDADDTITVWHAREDRDVIRAIWLTDTPGLVIQQALTDDDVYVVTHQRSSLVVATPPCGCFAAAEDVADLLSDCGNWDRPGSDIASDAPMREEAAVLLAQLRARAAAATISNLVTARRVRSEAMQL